MRHHGNDDAMTPHVPATSLATLPPGKNARVTSINGGRGLAQRAASMGIIPGTELEIIRAGRGGPVLVRVHQSRIVLGRGMAQRILVKREE